MACKVLVVDDSKLARMAVAKALNALHPDWARVEASSAEEALSLARQSAFDYAIVDFNMPGHDGLHLAAELRAASPTTALAVISANHQREIVERANAVGAAFLPKPLTEQTLEKFLFKVEAERKART